MKLPPYCLHTRLLVEKLHKELASLVVTAECHTMLNWLMFPKMFLVIIVMQFLVNDGIVVVQLLSLEHSI